MSDISCDPPVTPPDYDHPSLENPQGQCQLIERQRTAMTLTNVRTVDSLTALKRGLKEYLLALEFTHPAGRTVRFLRAFDTWAEHEEKAVFPSVIVYAKGTSTYEASGLTPAVRSDCKTEEGDYLVKLNEMIVPLTVEVYCTDPEERIAIAMMLEDSLNPVNWMYGFQLDLPFYHGLRATYSVDSTQFVDDTQNALSRSRMATIQLTGQISQVRCSKITTFKPELTLTVEDGNC